MAAKSNDPLFALIDALFSSKEYINNITKETAKQNIYMVLRRLAIKYPLQTNAFNVPKANPLEIIKYWSDYLYTGGEKPSWMYIKGTKAKEKKNSKYTSSEIKEYKKYYDIGDKEFDACMRFYPEETEKEIGDLMKFLKEIKTGDYECTTD